MRPLRFSLAFAALLAALPACSLIVGGQTECKSNADCAEGAACAQGLCAQPSADAGAPDSGDPDAGAPAKVVLSGIAATATAGVPSNVTVRVLDANDNPITGFTGSVSFTSTDDVAIVPGPYTFLASENGSHTFSAGVTLKTAGTQSVTATVTATGVNLTRKHDVVVSAAGVDHLAVSGVGTSIPTAFPQNVTVVAQDAYGNPVGSYRGKVHFSSEDVSTTLPADYTFTQEDEGSHTFTKGVQFAKVGRFSVTATDTTNAAINGAERNIDVVAGAANHLSASGISATVVAGQAKTVTVTALDSADNTAPSYRDTVTMTSNDTRATFTPPTHTYLASDNGIATFVVRFGTVGTWSVTAKDVALRTGSQTGIVVIAAPATALVVAGIANPIVDRATSDVTVTAVDGFGNTDKSYRGTVHFTSSDSGAVLPVDYPFVAGDNGTHRFTAGVSFRKAGTQSVTATDTVTSTTTGKQDPITVVPGVVAVVTFTQQPADNAVGQPFGPVQVRLADQDGNVATNATAQVTLSIATGPTGAALAGTMTATPSNGLATFNGLSVDRMGAYTLKAAVAGISASGTSNPFNASCPTGYTGPTCTACANGYKASTLAPGTCVPVCSEANPCTSPPADTCSGNTLTSHANPGSCSASGSAPYFTCTYGTTPVDCTPTSAHGICFVNACIEDPCFGVTCSNAAPDCDADGVTRNTYVASCVVTGAATHNCAQAKTATLCPGQICLSGACTAAAAPGAGDLVVSEVMHAPAANSVTKRWFELKNLTAGVLNLAGLVVDDGSGQSISLPASPPVPLAAGANFVFGDVPAAYVNAAPIPGPFAIGASGHIRVTAGSTVVDDLSWDASFPQTTGAAMNLSAKFVKPLANLRSFRWCDATTAMSGSGSDLGTPGAANVDCAQAGTTVVNPNHQLGQCLNTLPSSIAALPAGTASASIFGQVSDPGVSDQSRVANDYYPFLEAQLGYGPTSNDDATTWTWNSASWSPLYSSADSALDEFTSTLVIPLPGQYRWGWRFRLTDDSGTLGPWTYCDNTGIVVNPTAVGPANFPTVTVQ
jgi:hypothetical protein